MIKNAISNLVAANQAVESLDQNLIDEIIMLNKPP